MNTGLCILLLYITPMLLCLAIGIVVNWKDIRTVGDLLLPLFRHFGLFFSFFRLCPEHKDRKKQYA